MPSPKKYTIPPTSVNLINVLLLVTLMTETIAPAKAEQQTTHTTFIFQLGDDIVILRDIVFVDSLEEAKQYPITTHVAMRVEEDGEMITKIVRGPLINEAVRSMCNTPLAQHVKVFQFGGAFERLANSDVTIRYPDDASCLNGVPYIGDSQLDDLERQAKKKRDLAEKQKMWKTQKQQKRQDKSNERQTNGVIAQTKGTRNMRFRAG